MTTTPDADRADQDRRPSNHEDDEMLTITEAAALLRLPEATLRYWRHIGSGPHSFRLGRHVRYWRTQVVAWVDEQSQDTHGPHERSSRPAPTEDRDRHSRRAG